MDNRPSSEFEPFPREALEESIPARFERMVERFPGNLAVRSQTCALTYAELNALSNRVAQTIYHAGAPSNMPIVLVCDHDWFAIAAILGILKTGNFYSALDLNGSRSQAKAIFRELEPPLVVTDRSQSATAKQLAGSKCRVLQLESLLEIPDEKLNLEVSPDALAYAFFTSGTTGHPKGVIDSHRNVLHNILRYTNSLHISAKDRLTLLQLHSFSGSVSSLFCALLNGAAVFPFDPHHQGVGALANWIAENRITMFHSVPSIFRLIAAHGCRFDAVRVIRLEGDQASTGDVALFQKHFSPSCVLVNGLGATECGLVRQYFLRTSSPSPTGTVPIGYAVEDTEVLLLDENDQPSGPGEIGQIAIKSRYLALGYWKQPALTAAAFRAIADEPGMRMYLTGDLGRFIDGQCLEYLGRKDFQTKLHGRRINLAEIEAELLKIAGIREAIVVIRPDTTGESRLTAYYTHSHELSLSPAGIREALRPRLPEHAMPFQLIPLDALPLNSNGKIDREALPAPRRRRPTLTTPYKPPTGETQILLTTIWRQILDLEEVGIDDSFLDLGGDSLQAMRMLARCLNAFGVDIPIAHFFDQPTIAGLSKIMIDRTES